jgi:DNA polymerase-3 subunit chi
VATAVDFHTGVAEPLDFACRLLRKAVRLGATLLVTAPDGLLAELDRALWTFDERDFVPHVRVPGAAAALMARTPIWLSSVAEPPAAGPAYLGPVPTVLVNLGAAAAADLAPYSRLIEIVGRDVDAAQAGRERWRDYKARGLLVTHHPHHAPA